MSDRPEPNAARPAPGAVTARLWPRLAGQVSPDAAGAGSAALAARLGRLASAALAGHLFPGLVDPGIVCEAALLNRFRRTAGLRWAGRLSAAGLDVVCLKGLATAYLAYADPDLRGLSDADLLVRPADLSPACGVLESEGFRFFEVETRSPWGFVGDASFQPLVSSDGAVNLDLHVEPDAWPLYLGLDSAAVFAAARPVKTELGPLAMPAAEHALLLAVSHAARDLFGRAAVKGLIDAARLVAGAAGPLDWREIRTLARAGRMAKPLGVVLALFRDLGITLPAGAEAAATRGSEYRRLARELDTLFEAGVAAEPGPLTKVRREWLLAAEPGVAFGRNLRRLTGLVRPRRGLPAR